MKYFITFGAGGQNYYDAVNRLVNQAQNLNYFDKIIGYTDNDLKKDDEFWNKHSNFIENNKRGYGYWLWKPYIIKKTMENMKDGDILLYSDCGCEIDIGKQNKIIQLFNEFHINNDLICTSTGQIEKKWNKMDLIVKLNMLDDKYLNTNQYQAGVVLYSINDKTKNFINEWYDLGCDYHNIDDSPSIIKNSYIFNEHRHDQSIFSLLLKKHNLKHNCSLNQYIEIKRNKSGISQLK
jgi:galactitol-specific phosphotransferase system IIB component